MLQSIYKNTVSQLTKLYNPREATAITQWLLSDMTQIPKHLLATEQNITLSDETVKKIQHAVSQLLEYCPIQYVLGYTEFYGHQFIVSPSVLIPRQETEELVHWIIEDYQQQKNLRFLDICSGSGCIALTLARHLHQSKGIAWDISEKAIEIARQNGCNDNIVFQQVNILENIPSTESFDFIVSNPPYVCENEKENLEFNVLNFEPHIALFVPDNHPLLFYEKIATFASQNLEDQGSLYFEINCKFGRKIVELLVRKGFEKVELRKDIDGKERMIKAIWQKKR